MKKVYLVFLIIFLISCNKSRNEANFSREIDFRNYLDSSKNLNYNLLKRKDFAENAYRQIIKDNQRQISLFEIDELADIFYSLNNFKKSKEIFKIILKEGRKQKNDLLVAESLYNIAYCEMSMFSNDSSYYYFSKAEKYYIKGKKLDNIANIKINKANILWSKNDFAGAESLAIASLKNALNTKDYLTIYSCYITIGNCLLGMNNDFKALEYYKKAIAAVDKIERDKQGNLKISAIHYIAKIYQKQSQHQKAISILENEIDETQLRELDIKLYCYQKNTKNYSKFKLGDKSVVNQFLETLKIGDSLQFAPIQVTSKTHLGEYYLAQKDTATANFYLKDAQNQAHKNDIFEDELTILKLLGEANPQQNSYYSNRFIQLNDSLQIEERKTRDKFARIEFETDQIISQKESVEKENVQLSSRIWIIVGFSILLVLILLLWFMNKSQKAKTRELLLKQEQQKANEEIYQLMIDQQQKIEEGKNIEKQRISLDLHDSVMGKLTAVRMNLYVALLKNNLADDEDFSKQIDEIQEVEKEIRAIAHDLNSNLFSDNVTFVSVVKELFSKIENHSQLQFNLHVSEILNWDLVSKNIKINLYRILQEAFQNIEKYANANQVTITITASESNTIEVTISDDGNGFDDSKKSLGIGVKNMKQRIEDLKGSFAIESKIGNGTKINLIIPIQ